MRRTITSTSMFVFALAMLGATALMAQDDEVKPVEPNINPDAIKQDAAAKANGSSGHLCQGGKCGTCFPRPGERTPDLFYNYYLPAGCGEVGADLYMSPFEVPPHVGSTSITYQPLMPHEFLYPHHRTYYQYYDGGRGLNRTSVKYSLAPFQRVGHALHTFRIAR